MLTTCPHDVVRNCHCSRLPDLHAESAKFKDELVQDVKAKATEVIQNYPLLSLNSWCTPGTFWWRVAIFMTTPPRSRERIRRFSLRLHDMCVGNANFRKDVHFLHRQISEGPELSGKFVRHQNALQCKSLAIFVNLYIKHPTFCHQRQPCHLL